MNSSASRRVAAAATLLAVSVGCERRTVPPPHAAASSPRLMTPQDLQALPSRAPDRRVPYGKDSSQYGELRVPAGAGPHPVVVLIHGGCFKAAYANTRDLAPMADTLKADGIATWNIEYRRLGEPGGGWPGTYLDVGTAVDYLRTLAGQYQLDLGRVVIAGHSAGGHLAMWAAARSRLPTSSSLYMAAPLPLRGVIDLAGPIDMTANIQGYEALCRDTVITSLLGGTPATVPERYEHASAIRLLPLGVPQVLVEGTQEEFVPLPLMEAYAEAARRAGDPVQLVVIPGAGHFEIASPRSPAWPRVKSAIRSLLGGRLPAGASFLRRATRPTPRSPGRPVPPAAPGPSRPPPRRPPAPEAPTRTSSGPPPTPRTAGARAPAGLDSSGSIGFVQYTGPCAALLDAGPAALSR